MTDEAPRTEAGRRLMSKPHGPFMLDAILAIEREAAAHPSEAKSSEAGPEGPHGRDLLADGTCRICGPSSNLPHNGHDVGFIDPECEACAAHPGGPSVEAPQSVKRCVTHHACDCHAWIVAQWVREHPAEYARLSTPEPSE